MSKKASSLVVEEISATLRFGSSSLSERKTEEREPDLITSPYTSDASLGFSDDSEEAVRTAFTVVEITSTKEREGGGSVARTADGVVEVGESEEEVDDGDNKDEEKVNDRKRDKDRKKGKKKLSRPEKDENPTYGHEGNRDAMDCS